jgi:hypothetical protein
VRQMWKWNRRFAKAARPEPMRYHFHNLIIT